MYNLGIIGSGSRMTELVRKMIAYPDIRLKAVADPRVDAMKENYKDVEGGLPSTKPPKKCSKMKSLIASPSAHVVTPTQNTP